MADPQRVSRFDPEPPPAPPLPPARQLSGKAGVLQRLVAPLGFGFASRQPGAQDSHDGGHHVRRHTGELRSLASHEDNASHRTGIPISALDISPHKTHAVLAGREILKTIRVDDGKILEDINLRGSLLSASIRTPAGKRDFIPATDVKWSHSEYDTTIATAGSNGRVVLYDLTRADIELGRLHEHDRQVHKLAFSPFGAAKLLSGSQDGTLRLWDIRAVNGERGAAGIQSRASFQGRAEAIRDVRWSPADSMDFAFCTDSGSVQLWDIRKTNTPKLRINAHEKPCYALDWHPDGKHIATAGFDKDIKIWDFSNLDRRQKPSFTVRAPQAIMKLRWRPACWSSELQDSGDWQCTQLVTSYNQEDPRIHIWDLRRHHIPFREINATRGHTSDLLWHSKDLLWTVGREGTFQQTDTKYAPSVLDQLNPCHISFTPSGSFVKFTEKRSQRRSFGWQEAADTFLNQQSFGGKARSWDEDEAVHDNYMALNLRRRQTKDSKFSKSQGNTPPSRDERIPYVPVLPLEESVEKNGPFINRQLGLMQDITGASLNSDAFRYLAENYARPVPDETRRRDPKTILRHLETIFNHNADVCGDVSMYRLAQTWRIIGAVLIPELEAWAEKNRQERLQKGLHGASTTKGIDRKDNAFAEVKVTGPENAQSEMAKRSLFKRILDTDVNKDTKFDNNTSNVTTPLAQPLPDSPRSRHDRMAVRRPGIDDEIDHIAPLPDSLLNSHNTAAVAAEVLRRSPSPTSRAETLPPDQASHTPPSPKTSGMDDYDPQRSSPQAISNSPIWKEDISNREEDRRAALRDYRAQSRPVLTFDNEPSLTRPAPPNRHDSTESFTMFSTSTASSSRPKSVGLSLESHRVQNPESWRPTIGSQRNSVDQVSQPYEGGGRLSTIGSVSRRNSYRDSTLFEYGPHGSTLPSDDSGVSQILEQDLHGSQDDISFRDSSFGRPTDEHLPFEFEPSSFPMKSDSNTGRLDLPIPNTMKKKNFELPEEGEVLSPDFIYHDFRPMNSTTTDDKDSFGWDTISLVAAAIEFDLTASHDNVTCQFTAHLLMHISPFFDTFSDDPIPDVQLPVPPRNIASRLRVHSHARRIAETTFANYLQFLLSHELYSPAAEIKNFAYDWSYSITHTEGPSPAQELRVLLTCGHCGKLRGGENVALTCSECNYTREPCAICLMADVSLDIDDCKQGHSMWTMCIGCGHGGHVDCISEWLTDPDSHGACPTPGCWHDCGPGTVRQERIEVQTSHWGQETAAGKPAKASNATMMTAAGAATRQDSWVVSQSAAVGRARKELREPSWSRKQVRLLAPGEASGGVALSSSH